MDKNSIYNKFWIVLIINSLFLLWVDAIICCDKFLGFSLEEIGYHFKLYWLLVVIPWISLLIYFPQYRKLWIGGILITWCMNDLLWFLVKPEEWIKFWQFKNEVIYHYKVYDGMYLPITDIIMFLSIVIRISLGILLIYKEICPVDRRTESS